MRQHVFLVGFMGSGKSTVGPVLAAALGVPFVDLDERIAKEQDRTIAEIFESRGESYFRAVESRLLERVAADAPSVVAVGGGAYVSEGNRGLMRTSGTTVWLDVSLEVAWRRCAGDPTRPLAADSRSFERLFQERRAVYRLADIRVEASHHKSAQIVAGITRRLGRE